MTLGLFDKHLVQFPAAEKKTHSDHKFRGLKLPKRDINRDTTLTLSFELVQDPRWIKDGGLNFEFLRGSC